MTTPLDTRRLANAYRTMWYKLMEAADDLRLDRDAAFNLTTAVIELARLGYVLTPDETDWQPTATQQPATVAGEEGGDG